MDDDFELNGIRFVWDKTKARRNLATHGVAFEQAAEAFFDPFLRLVDASPGEEARDAIIGMDKCWNLLIVVHIAIEEAQIRSVSTRNATRHERLFYED